MPNTAIKLALAAAAVLGVFAFAYIEGEEQSTAPLSDHPWWSRKIDKAGIAAAYKEFVDANSTQPLGLQHANVHFIGELLYQKAGRSGFLACDSSFAYGCYHGFFAAILSDQGLAAVSDLNNSCLEKYAPQASPCQHGLGHGIMSYLGRDNLAQALDICRQTHQKDPLNGCSAGVFMEYNISTHFSENGAGSRRELNPTNPHEPCNTIVSEDFRQSCYHEISLWWREVFAGDFEKIGRLCQEIADANEQKACYLGLGTVVAPTSNYTAGEAVALCKKMPDLKSEVQCRSGVFGVFSGLPATAGAAAEICRGLPPQEHSLCARN